MLPLQITSWLHYSFLLVNLTDTSPVTSLIFVPLLSCNQFCSEPLPRPIHLNGPYVTTPIPRVSCAATDKIIWLALLYHRLSVSSSIPSFFYLQPSCCVQPSRTSLKPQTTSRVINQPLVLKGYFISSKRNQYPQQCTAAPMSVRSLSHVQAGRSKDLLNARDGKMS